MSREARANFGCFGSETAALEAILTRLATALDPQAIWLFGSRATGRARPDSDFDLLVVAKPGGCFGSDDYDTVDRPLRGTGVGCDIVPCAATDFEDCKRLKTTLIARVVREGRVVYEAGAQ